MSFQYADIVVIALMSMVLILRDRDMTLEKANILFLFNGVAVAFFDFLTYPIAAVGIPLITLLLVNDYSWKEACNRVLAGSVAWGAGYGAMWAGKWIMAFLLTGENVIQDGLERVSFRMGVSGLESGSFQDTVSANISYFYNRPMYVLAIIPVVFISVYLVKNRNRPSNNLADILPIAFVGLYPFFWFYIVRNHSYTHPFLEFRILSVSFWAFLAIVLKLKPIDKPT